MGGEDFIPLTMADNQGMLCLLDKEDDSARISSDDELRSLLDAAERRRDDEILRKGKVVSWILIVPTLLVLGSAGIFLLTYDSENSPSPDKPALLPQVADENGMKELDPFRPNSQKSSLPIPKTADGTPAVKNEDIEFALQLLNFSNGGVPQKVEKK